MTIEKIVPIRTVDDNNLGAIVPDAVERGAGMTVEGIRQGHVGDHTRHIMAASIALVTVLFLVLLFAFI